jgi:hypothetical protein
MRLLGLMLGLLCLAGCSERSGPPVELILPNGFTGTVWLVQDPAGQEIPLVDGGYRITVPAAGVLRFRSLPPVEQWDTFSARYGDGTPIPWDYASFAGAQPDAVAVRAGMGGVMKLGGRDVYCYFFFVGTAKQQAEMLAADRAIPGVDE